MRKFKENTQCAFTYNVHLKIKALVFFNLSVRLI